jgi:type I restriction enzyme R subunit
LVKLSRSLSEEQQRHVRENMTEEELVIFDILIRPAPELTTEERAEVKRIARELLNRLKQLLVLNWRQKAAARSQLKLAIEDILDSGLPRAYAQPVSAEVLGGVRAYVRKLSRAECGCLCSSGLNMR